MINAMEARRKTALRGAYKEYMDMIESKINESIEAGMYDVYISFNNISEELSQMLIEELTESGYKTEYEPAQPCPEDCPFDQWDFHSHMTISWE